VNIPKTFEAALSAVIRAHSGLSPMPRLRTHMGTGSDLGWTVQTDRVFPVVTITCGAPRVDAEDGVTCLCNAAIVVATNANDDQTHERLAANYEGVQKCLDALYSQFRAGSTGAERTTFDAALTAAWGSSPVPTVGGFQHGDPMDPTDEGGIIAIGLGFVIHFSRSDF